MRPPAFVVILLLACPAFSQTTANVLVIIADDMGVHEVGKYRGTTGSPSTPNLDALADRGVLFRRAYSCPNCSPTRACLMTGRYPLRHMVGSYLGPETGVLKKSEFTFPDALKAGNTYKSALIGKWHLNPSNELLAPNCNGGFDHYAGRLEGSFAADAYCNWKRIENGQQIPSGNVTDYLTWRQTEDAIQWIGTQGSTPWVCVLSFDAPHAPFHDPPEFGSKVCPTIPTGAADRAKYEAMIEYLDNEIGRLSTRLGAEVMANTNVIFFGDNGTPRQVATGNQWHAKGTPYEGGVNVPMIIAGPAVQGSAREENALVHVTDIYATILQMTNTTIPDEIDGVSMVPYLVNSNVPSMREFVYSELFEGTAWPAPLQTLPAVRPTKLENATPDKEFWNHLCLRNDTYKLIHIVRTTPLGLIKSDEFYNLEQDPSEMYNLIALAKPPLTGVDLTNFTALDLELARLHAPPTVATIVGYGEGCRYLLSPDPLEISHAGVPKIGTSYQIMLTYGPAFQPAFLTIDFDSEHIDIGGGCHLYAKGILYVSTMTDNMGAAQWTLNLADNPPPAGTTFYHQWVVLCLGSPPCTGGPYTSDALAATVGNVP